MTDDVTQARWRVPLRLLALLVIVGTFHLGAVPASAAAKKFTATPTPTISGTVKVGKTLTAKPGKWQPKPAKLTYQWYRNGKRISGATKSTYKLKTGDASKKITVKVTGSKKGYNSVSKTSKSKKVPAVSKWYDLTTRSSTSYVSRRFAYRANGEEYRVGESVGVDILKSPYSSGWVVGAANVGSAYFRETMSFGPFGNLSRTLKAENRYTSEVSYSMAARCDQVTAEIGARSDSQYTAVPTHYRVYVDGVQKGEWTIEPFVGPERIEINTKGAVQLKLWVEIPKGGGGSPAFGAPKIRCASDPSAGPS